MSHSLPATFILSLILLCGSFCTDASSTTWHVRQDGTGDTSSLATAIASALGGDSILVGPGGYSIYQGFTVSKPLHIVSEQGPEVTVIANHSCIGVGGPCLGSWGFWVHDFSGSFTIRGFTIQNCGDCLELICPDYDGSGIAVQDASGIVADNILSDNHSWGGAVRGSCSVVFERNLIRTNISMGITVYDGAAVEIRSNTFSEGSPYYAGHVWIYGATSNVSIHHNIFANSPGKGIVNQTPGATVIIECNDFWNNAKGNYGGTLGDPVGTNGNIGADPLFCGAGIFTIRADSPCAETQVPSACSGLSMGCYPVDCPVGVKSTSWGNLKSLFRPSGH